MGLFKRISDNVRANLNHLLEKTEDPVKMLEQYLRDMEDDIADAEMAVAKQMAVVKRFESSYKEAQGMADKRTAQAMEALEKNREDLARKALEDKRVHAARAADYREQYEQARSVADTLKKQLQDMKNELTGMQARRATLVARAEAARAQKEINKVMSGFGKDTARKGFERMEEKILQCEAEASAGLELRNTGKDLDEELGELKGGTSEIDRELQHLKTKLQEKKE